MDKKIHTEENQNSEEESFYEWMETMPDKALDLSKDKEEVFWDFYNRLLAGDYKEKGNSKASFIWVARAFVKSYYEAGKEKEIESFIDKEAWKVKYKSNFPLITKFTNDFFSDEKVEIKNSEEMKKCFASIAAQKLSTIFGSCVQVTNQNDKVVDTGFKLAVKRMLEDKGYVEKAGFMTGGPQAEINEKYQPMILNMYVNTANSFVRHRSGLKRKMDDNKFESVWDAVEEYLQNCESLMTENTKKNPNFKKAKAEYEAQKSIKHHIRDNYTLTGIYGDYYNNVLSCVKRFKAKTNTPKDNEIAAEFLKRTQKIHRALSYKDSLGRSYTCNYYVYTDTPPMSMVYLIGDFSKNVPGLSDKDVKMLAETKTLVRRAFGERIRNKQNVHSYPAALQMFKFRTKDHDLTDEKNFENFTREVENNVKKFNLPRTELCAQMVGIDLLKGKTPVKIEEIEEVKTK